MIFKNLSNEDIELISLDMKYLDDMFEYSSDPRLYDYFEFPPQKTIKETERYLKKLIKRSSAKSAYWYFIKIKKDSKVIGSLGIHDIDLQRNSCEISYAISPKYWGKGIFSSVMELALDYLINDLSFYRINALTAKDNIRSNKALQKFGFIQEGTLVDYYKKHDERYFDASLYALLISKNKEKKAFTKELTRKKNLLMITGMIRSGSTLLTRVLNAHPEINLASDIVLSAYKSCLYNKLCMSKELSLSMSVADFPISPGYCDESYSSIIELIKNSTIDTKISSKEKKRLKEIYMKDLYMEPDFENKINDIDSYDTYEDLIDYLFSAIKQIDKKNKYYGTKETYFDDFRTWVNIQYPDNKYIHIIRNPLSIYLSLKNTKTPYPLVYVLYYWRKHVAQAIQSAKKYKSLIIKYEDLCYSPERTTKDLCNYLKIKFDSYMLNHKSWKYLSGKNWSTNSSYQDTGNQVFYTESADRWKTDANSNDIAVSLFLCENEMKYFYPNVTSLKKDIDQDFFISSLLPTNIEKNKYPKYLKDYKYDRDMLKKLWVFENKRNNFLQKKGILSNKLIQKYFINKECYEFMINKKENEKI